MVAELRSMLVNDLELISLIKGMKDFLINKAGVVVKKMITEILLHLAYQKEMLADLVSNVNYFHIILMQGMIGYLLDLRSSIK